MNAELIPLLGLLYGIYLLYDLFRSIGRTMPFIEITLALAGMQLLIAPFLDYTYFQNDIFGIMKVPAPEYFNFMLPAIASMHLGIKLGFPGKRDYQELIFFEKFKTNKYKNIRTGVNLIIAGYIAHIILFLPIPSAFSFILNTVDFLKFIGFFYIWLSGSKYTRFFFFIVFGPFILEAINQTIFIDLIIWAFFLLSVYAFKKKINKAIILILGIFAFSFLFTLQTVKYAYRAVVWSQEESSSIDNIKLLGELMSSAVTNMDQDALKLAGGAMNVRVNQGWIITDIMSHYEKRKILNTGHWFYRELLGVLLPRFLYPNKPVVGDHDKFEEFAGWRMADKTSMNVGIAGDGYGNFGYTGGIIFCLGFGYFIGLGLKKLYEASDKYPELIFWGILIFFYVMRAGNEFYIIANWIVKTGIFTFLFFFIFKNRSIISTLFRPLPQSS